jgi:hypothetical protein
MEKVGGRLTVKYLKNARRHQAGCAFTRQRTSVRRLLRGTLGLFAGDGGKIFQRVAALKVVNQRAGGKVESTGDFWCFFVSSVAGLILGKSAMGLNHRTNETVEPFL